MAVAHVWEEDIFYVVQAKSVFNVKNDGLYIVLREGYRSSRVLRDKSLSCWIKACTVEESFFLVISFYVKLINFFH